MTLSIQQCNITTKLQLNMIKAVLCFGQKQKPKFNTFHDILDSDMQITNIIWNFQILLRIYHYICVELW